MLTLRYYREFGCVATGRNDSNFAGKKEVRDLSSHLTISWDGHPVIKCRHLHASDGWGGTHRTCPLTCVWRCVISHDIVRRKQPDASRLFLAAPDNLHHELASSAAMIMRILRLRLTQANRNMGKLHRPTSPRPGARSHKCLTDMHMSF
jgi:hypothetical protein